jgi:arginyl-tRNA synthetase
VVVLKVKDQEEKLAQARQLLFEAARITLHNGLRMLGLSATGSHVRERQ